MSTACYANNGSLYENTATIYVPCNLTAVENGGHSACCALDDLCMTSGLCLQPANEAKGANHYWRNGCTDKTFKDPACPNVCRGREEPGRYNAFIFYCFQPSNKYCCAPQGTLEVGVTGRNTSCCDDSDLTFTDDVPLIAGTARAELPRLPTTASVPSTAASTSATSQSPSIFSTTAVSASATPTSSAPSSSISSGAKAGMGVGITLGVLAIIAIIGAIFFMRRRKVSASGNPAMLLTDSKTAPSPYVTYESAGTARAELDGTMLPAEMHYTSAKAKGTTTAGREVGSAAK